MNKLKKYLKENYKFIIFLVLMVLIVTVELPYYIEAPGGTINLSKRINDDYKKSDGSLNMLYVTEYRGNVVTVLLSKIINSWDLYEISNQQLSNESQHDIYLRNRVMLDNSIQNAIFVAYHEAGKDIKITNKENIVIGKLKENDFEIGDIILEMNNTEVENIDTIKEYLNSATVGDRISFLIKRNNHEKNITVTLDEDLILGIMMITNYQYELDEDLDIVFKFGEGGSSGGLILALGVYSKITGVDFLKGRNIAGTGTIDIYGNVGEIDGIKYKIAGAVKNNMDIVMVADANYEEARQIIQDNNYDIELVKISTFKEAIDYLTQ